MNILKRFSNLWALSRSIENPSVPLSLAGITSQKSSTGIAVTPDKSLELSSVWGAVRAISSDIGNFPFSIYEKDGRFKRELTDHRYYFLIHNEPNEFMSSNIFIESILANTLLWGNGYAMMIRKGGVIKSFELWESRDTVIEHANSGNLYYSNEKLGRKQIAAVNMIHIPGLAFDGKVGKSPITLARENVGLGLALQEFGGAFFGNGANLGGVLEHPGELSPEARKNIITSWNNKHGGVENALSTALLEEGMKYNSIGIPPEDAQFLGTRKFSVNDIARIFRIPPHKIQDLERSTNNNIEQQSIEYVTDTLKSWVIRIEKEFNRKIFTSDEKGRVFTKMNLNSLLRGDIKARGDWYSKGRQWGWFSENDIRQLEDMNPIDNGDNYLVPMNMTTVDKLSKEDEQIIKELKNNNHG